MRGNRFIDRTGERIGYITITKLSDEVYVNPTTNVTTLKWEYKCDCGNVGTIKSSDINKRKNYKIKASCGCNAHNKRDKMLLIQSGRFYCTMCDTTKPIEYFYPNYIKKKIQCCKKCRAERNHEEYKKLRNNPKKWKSYLKKQRSRKDYQQEYQTIQQDPLRRARTAIRKRILHGLKVRNIKKSKLCMKSEEILGCSFQHFKDHIESQFTNGMNWLNHGEWHLDHKVPLALANNVDELIKLNHWTNFQPLWSGDNLSKGDVLLDEHIDLYQNLLG